MLCEKKIVSIFKSLANTYFRMSVWTGGSDVSSELKLGVSLSNNLSKYEVFSFQPIEALELESVTSKLKIQVPY